jgi:hypothetical protein
MYRESGFGRYDICLIPKRDEKENKFPGIIIEFKIQDEQKEKRLDQTAQIALQQIKDKEYVQVFKNLKPIPPRIIAYGIAFAQKKVDIKKMELQTE